MKVPNRFEDITLKQFIDLHKLSLKSFDTDLEKDIEKLSILSGESIDYINDLEPKKFYEYLNKCSFLDSINTNFTVKKSIRAKGYKLIATTSLNDMKVNQLVDFYGLFKQHNNDYILASNDLLAVLYKHKQMFKPAVYSPDKHATISEILLSAKAYEVLGLLFFYSNYWRKCAPIIHYYLEKQMKVLTEQIQEIEKDSLFQDFLANGGGNITSTFAEKIQE